MMEDPKNNLLLLVQVTLYWRLCGRREIWPFSRYLHYLVSNLNPNVASKHCRNAQAPKGLYIVFFKLPHKPTSFLKLGAVFFYLPLRSI